MSGDSTDDLLAQLTAAIERVDLAAFNAKEAADRLVILGNEREVRDAVEATRKTVRTLCEILIKRGQLAEGHRRILERLMNGPAAPARPVRLRVLDGKHEVAGPDIDCASRLHLCRARCCTLMVELAREDLEDGIRFNFDEPYVLLRGADGWCHYLDRAGGGCTIYDQRPATCRKFDCREDARIWTDFEAGIPAPLPARLDGDSGPTFAPPTPR